MLALARVLVSKLLVVPFLFVFGPQEEKIVRRLSTSVGCVVSIDFSFIKQGMPLLVAAD
jgi:hypothetical protein